MSKGELPIEQWLDLYLHKIFADNYILKIIIWWLYLIFWWVPNLPFIVVSIFVLLAIDTFLWVLKAVITSDWISWEFKVVWYKAFIYAVILGCVIILEKHIWTNFIILKIVSSFIVVYDFWSILEKLNKLWVDEFMPVLKPLTSILAINKQKLNKLVVTTFWTEEFWPYLEQIQELKEGLKDLDNTYYQKMFARDLEWIESVITKLIKTKNSNILELFERRTISLWINLRNHFKKSKIPDYYVEYYMKGHNLQEANVLKQLKAIENKTDYKNCDALKGTMIALLLNWITKWILAGVKSPRNLGFNEKKNENISN